VMSAPSKVYNIQLVRIRPNDWLVATIGPNVWQNMMAGCYGGREMEYLGWGHGIFGDGGLGGVSI